MHVSKEIGLNYCKEERKKEEKVICLMYSDEKRSHIKLQNKQVKNAHSTIKGDMTTFGCIHELNITFVFKRNSFY